MDSFTQAALGAAIGEAVLGRKIGRKGAIWGAVAGTLPDLDVLVGPFVSEVQALALHRGLTHSILFALTIPFIASYFLRRLYDREGVSWKDWALMLFLAFMTHTAIDALTTYGTQVFYPFSDYPVSIGSIFIIDPLYTVPLVIGLLTALLQPRGSKARRYANAAGLGLSTFYLLITLVNKQVAHTAFVESLRKEGISTESLISTPTPLNSILWTGMAIQGDSIFIGQFSLLDEHRMIEFRAVPRNSRFIQTYHSDPVLQRLMWFSRGFYTVSRTAEGILYHDVRFGRSDFWLSDEGDFVFTFKLIPVPENPQELQDFEQMSPSFDLNRDLIQSFASRVIGRYSRNDRDLRVEASTTSLPPDFSYR